MTREDQIALHEKIITGLIEHIAWLEQEKFTEDGKTTAELVAECERIIAANEALIDKILQIGGVE